VIYTATPNIIDYKDVGGKYNIMKKTKLTMKCCAHPTVSE